MSNETKSLQKIERKDNVATKLSAEITVKSVMEIIGYGGGVMTLLATFLTIIIGFFIGLPVYFYIPLGAIVFFLVALSFYLFSYRPKIKVLNLQIESLTAKQEEEKAIDALKKEHQRQIETLVETHQEAINREKELYQSLQKSNKDEREFYQKQYGLDIQNTKVQYEQAIAQKDAVLLENQSLIDLAKEQKANIENYVVLKKFFFCYISTETVPTAYFALEIRNNSYFDVELDDNIGNLMEFEMLRLRGVKFFHSTTPRIIRSISTERITFAQQLSGEDMKFIEDFTKKRPDMQKEHLFRVNKLEFTIKGVNGDSQITARKLKIRDGFRVIDREKYDEAQEQFK